MANADSLAVGIKSGKRWQSGCMQGGTRLMDSKRTSTALSLARGFSHSDRLGPWPSVLSRHVMDLNQNTRSRHATGIARRARDVDRDAYNTQRNEERELGKGSRAAKASDATYRSVPGTVLALANEEQS